MCLKPTCWFCGSEVYSEGSERRDSSFRLGRRDQKRDEEAWLQIHVLVRREGTLPDGAFRPGAAFPSNPCRGVGPVECGRK